MSFGKQEKFSNIPEAIARLFYPKPNGSINFTVVNMDVFDPSKRSTVLAEFKAYTDNLRAQLEESMPSIEVKKMNFGKETIVDVKVSVQDITVIRL